MRYVRAIANMVNIFRIGKEVQSNDEQTPDVSRTISISENHTTPDTLLDRRNARSAKRGTKM